MGMGWHEWPLMLFTVLGQCVVGAIIVMGLTVIGGNLNEQQSRRHEVRPGLTGYAQVHGRNSVTWEEKFDMDVYYVDHVSFLMDWKIIFQTVLTVLKRDGITTPVCFDMEDHLNALNRFPPRDDFQCFLLDENNRVVCIGNPVHNPRIKEMYLSEIASNVQTETSQL